MGEIDWTRVLVLGAVIFVVALAREHLGILQSESRWKRYLFRARDLRGAAGHRIHPADSRVSDTRGRKGVFAPRIRFSFGVTASRCASIAGASGPRRPRRRPQL